MTKLLEITKDIITDLQGLRNTQHPVRSFPPTLGVGDGRYIEVSLTIIQLIEYFSREKMRSDASLKLLVAYDDMKVLVRSAFGPALSKIDLDNDIDENAKIVLSDVETVIKERIQRISDNGNREFAFGCTLFSYDDMATFDIGPVKFEPRISWLNRKASDGRSARVGSSGWIERFGHNIADGSVSKVTKRRIIRAWKGDRLKSRKNSHDSHNEQDILKAIGSCPYVCSVKIPGLGNKAGQEKALLAARLALTTISLMWMNSSKAIDGLNLLFDRELRIQSPLSFTPEGLMLGGGMKSNMPHAPWVERVKLEEHFRDFSDEFAVSGQAIEWLLDPIGNHSAPYLLNVITQAMLWFHDGCREVTDLKAIVSFASCLDILASGGGREGIRKLIHVRLGIDERTNFHRDGFTVKEIIDQIYDDGRTRFIHGPMKHGKHVWGDKLGHDWSETRGIAEWLARACLLCCMEWIAKNTTSDDPKKLLQ